MSRDNLLILVLVVSIANGILSPWIWIAISFAPAWMPSFLPFSTQTLFYGGSLLVSTFTFLLAGVPAALAERYLKDELPAEGSLWVWLGAALLLSIPSIEGLIGQI